MLRRLTQRENVRLVSPYTSSHELIREAAAVIVISSTVGLEALLYGQPVLTMGQPFYSGYGVTLDVDSFRELREAGPAVLRSGPTGSGRFSSSTLRFGARTGAPPAAGSVGRERRSPRGFAGRGRADLGAGDAAPEVVGAD